jgi:hypothetical protein
MSLRDIGLHAPIIHPASREQFYDRDSHNRDPFGVFALNERL